MKDKQGSSAPDTTHIAPCRDEACPASAPGRSDRGRFPEFAAQWWAQLPPETHSSWARRLGVGESPVPGGVLPGLAYRASLQDRRACELQLVSYYRAHGVPHSAREHEQQVQEIEPILALERKGVQPETDVVAGIAWWNDLTSGERAAWLIVSNAETAADAWAYQCTHRFSNLDMVERLGRLITGTGTRMKSP
jgi:hypothetical protein